MYLQPKSKARGAGTVMAFVSAPVIVSSYHMAQGGALVTADALPIVCLLVPASPMGCFKRERVWAGG